MTQLIEQVGGWIEELIAAIGYPGIVLVMAIENIFPPIPSEAVLPFAGSLSAKGELDFWGAVVAGTAGSLLGAVVLYGIGYFAREAGVRRLVENYGKYVFISEKDLDRGAEWFERYGEAVIFFGRLISAGPKHRLGTGGIYADALRSVFVIHVVGDGVVEFGSDVRGSVAGRELGRDQGLHGAVPEWDAGGDCGARRGVYRLASGEMAART